MIKTMEISKRREFVERILSKIKGKHIEICHRGCGVTIPLHIDEFDFFTVVSDKGIRLVMGDEYKENQCVYLELEEIDNVDSTEFCNDNVVMFHMGNVDLQLATM